MNDLKRRNGRCAAEAARLGRMLGSWTVLALLTVGAVQVYGATRPSALDAGAQLAAAVAARETTRPQRLQNWKDLRRSIEPMFCKDVRYRYYRIGEQMYAIGERSGKVVLGPHISFRVFGREADLNSVRGSTRCCRTLPLTEAVIRLTDQRLDQPSAIHVYISRRYQRVLEITTRTGIWRVDDKGIVQLRQLDDDRIQRPVLPVPLPPM